MEEWKEEESGRNVNWIFNDRYYFTAEVILKNMIVSDISEDGIPPDQYYGEKLKELNNSLFKVDVESNGWLATMVEMVAFAFLQGGSRRDYFLDALDCLTYYWINNDYPNIHEVRVYEDGETNVDAYVIERKISTVVGESNEKRKERMAEFNRSYSLSEEERREEVRRITEQLKEENKKEHQCSSA